MPTSEAGYTGHKQMDAVGIIHMKGRIYDPTLGRFLQADPHIQAPLNVQNYNRYSYVLNNPMSMTDPSGYIFKTMFRQIAQVPILNAVAQAVACFYGGPWGCAAYAAASTYATTGSLGASFRAGAIAFVSAKAFQQVGQHFGDQYGTFANATASGKASWIFSHAMVGGISSLLSGGKFGHGFFSAGFTKFAMGNAGFNYDDVSTGAIAGRTAIAAIIGGTASVISGGKFVNGAQTAAMAQLFNAEATNYRKKIKGWRAAEAAVRKRLVKEGYTIVAGRTSAKYDGDWYIRGREYDVVAYKVVNGERIYELVEVKYLKNDGLKYSNGPGRRAIGTRRMAQALVVSRQVHFDLHADTMTLSGKGLGTPVTIGPENYNISWEFVKPNGTGAVINVSNTKEFTNKILELTGG